MLKISLTKLWKSGLVSLVLIASALFISAAPALAQLDADDTGITNFTEVNDSVLDSMNPLKIVESNQAENLSNPGGFFTRLLDFVFPLGLVILFIMTLWGGFEMLSEAATKKSIDAGRQRIKAAMIGFILLFSSYWIIQVIELMFGVTIVGQ